MKVSIKRLEENEGMIFKDLIHLFIDVFEERNKEIPKDRYLDKLLKNPLFIVFVAVLENKVIGGLTAYELVKYFKEETEIFIYDMAISKNYQRSGVGKQLIEALKNHCREQGIKEFFVEAHMEDEHAVAFYQSTGGKLESVAHFHYFL